MFLDQMQPPKNRSQLVQFLKERPGLRLMVTRTSFMTVGGNVIVQHTTDPVERSVVRTSSVAFYMAGGAIPPSSEVYNESRPTDVAFRGVSNGVPWAWVFTDESFAFTRHAGDGMFNGEPATSWFRMDYRYAQS